MAPGLHPPLIENTHGLWVNGIMTTGLNKSFSFFTLLFVTILIGSATGGCIVDSVCFNDADCPSDKLCEIPAGTTRGACQPMCLRDEDCAEGFLCDDLSHRCVEAECEGNGDCEEGFECVSGNCRAEETLSCPEGMVVIDERFCIDVYEASRPDATEEAMGEDRSMAVSRVGARPWEVGDNQEAEDACLAAGKRLCTASEWHTACAGPDKTAYGYGDEYDPLICNGIDTYCYCDEPECQSREVCPFEYCYQSCGGASFHWTPTGAFEGCTNGYGVFDMNGNVWEHTAGGDETTIRGGAYNCLDSKQYHRCDYIPGDWSPAARGFRCCADGWIGPDGGVSDDGETS